MQSKQEQKKALLVEIEAMVGVVKEAVRLSALMPYEQVAETLEQVGQISISATTV